MFTTTTFAIQHKIQPLLLRYGAVQSRQWLLFLDGIFSASTIYASDPHSCIVDAKNGRQISKDTVKLLVWFDNDFGHANR